MKLKDIKLLDVGHTIQMAGVVYADQDRLYLCMLPDEHAAGRLPQVPLEMDNVDWEVFFKQADTLEVEVFENASDPTSAKIILRKSQRHIEQTVSWEVFRRDGYACRYCGKNDVPLTIDHAVCWEEGGPSTVANLVSACRPCNRSRGNKPFAAWLESAKYLQAVRAGQVSYAVHVENLALASRLDQIPRMKHRRSR